MKASIRYAPSEYVLEEFKSIEQTSGQASSVSTERPLGESRGPACKGKRQGSLLDYYYEELKGGHGETGLITIW